MAVLLFGAAPANADVLEIGADGVVTVISGPQALTPEGRTPLAPPAPEPLLSSPAPVRVADAIRAAAERTALSPQLIEAVAWTESRLNPAAVSPKGARGVMQLMPGTARDLGVRPDDLEQNVLGGATYLAAMLRRFDGDVTLALAAYNAGPGAVSRHGGVPPYRETQGYVRTVLERLSSTSALEPR